MRNNKPHFPKIHVAILIKDSINSAGRLDFYACRRNSTILTWSNNLIYCDSNCPGVTRVVWAFCRGFKSNKISAISLNLCIEATVSRHISAAESTTPHKCHPLARSYDFRQAINRWILLLPQIEFASGCHSAFIFLEKILSITNYTIESAWCRPIPLGLTTLPKPYISGLQLKCNKLRSTVTARCLWSSANVWQFLSYDSQQHGRDSFKFTEERTHNSCGE